jgi:DNA-binding NarL/FixJ family response regulator
MKQRIRVVVADLAPASGELLAEELSRTGQFEAAAAATPEQAQQILESVPADVLLISAGFGANHASGLSFVQRVREQHPDLQVIVLLDNSDKATVVNAFRAGARGVFARSDSLAALAKCIACVHQGQIWASSQNVQYLLEALAQPLAIAGSAPLARPLSQREEEIARLVAQGCSNRQISERLKLSEHTVKNYLFRVFEKLGVSTRVELTLFALKGGKVRRSRPQPRNLAQHPNPETLKNKLTG